MNFIKTFSLVIIANCTLNAMQNNRSELLNDNSNNGNIFNQTNIEESAPNDVMQELQKQGIDNINNDIIMKNIQNINNNPRNINSILDSNQQMDNSQYINRNFDMIRNDLPFNINAQLFNNNPMINNNRPFSINPQINCNPYINSNVNNQNRRLIIHDILDKIITVKYVNNANCQNIIASEINSGIRCNNITSNQFSIFSMLVRQQDKIYELTNNVNELKDQVKELNNKFDKLINILSKQNNINIDDIIKEDKKDNTESNNINIKDNLEENKIEKDNIKSNIINMKDNLEEDKIEKDKKDNIESNNINIKYNIEEDKIKANTKDNTENNNTYNEVDGNK